MSKFTRKDISVYKCKFETENFDCYTKCLSFLIFCQLIHLTVTKASFTLDWGFMGFIQKAVNSSLTLDLDERESSLFLRIHKTCMMSSCWFFIAVEANQGCSFGEPGSRIVLLWLTWEHQSVSSLIEIASHSHSLTYKLACGSKLGPSCGEAYTTPYYA